MSTKRFGKTARRVRKPRAALMKQVQSIVNPLRTFNADNAPVTILTGGASFGYSGQSVCGITDLRSLMSNIETNPPITTTTPLTGPLADNKFILEAATITVHGTNTCNFPIKVTCFWCVPRFDLYAATPATANPNTLLDLPSSGISYASVGHDNLNFDIYTSEVTKWWKFYKRQTVIVAPGCAVEFACSTGRRIIRKRQLYGYSGLSSPQWLKTASRYMLFQVTGASDGSSTASGSPHTTNPAEFAFHSKEVYEFRAMLDPRPQQVNVGSNLAQTGSGQGNMYGISTLTGAITANTALAPGDTTGG